MPIKRIKILPVCKSVIQNITDKSSEQAAPYYHLLRLAMELNLAIVQNKEIEDGSQYLGLFYARSLLSNFAFTPFIMEGKKWPTCEHYFQYKKAETFNDQLAMQAILQVEKPLEAKRIGQNIRGYDDTLWSTMRMDIMLRGLRAKFLDPNRRAVLNSTKPLYLVETSKYDHYWGNGLLRSNEQNSYPSKWPGQNFLGKCLMIVRDE